MKGTIASTPTLAMKSSNQGTSTKQPEVAIMDSKIQPKVAYVYRLG